MKLDCDVIRDLLPLYAEDMVSESSRKLIGAHFEACSECRTIYEEMTAPPPEVQFSKEPAESFQKYVKKEKRSFGWKIILISAGIWLLQFAAAMGLLWYSVSSARVEVDEDVQNYHLYMGENAKGEYRSKWGMDETIFPSAIEEPDDVLEYKMVYYNPWDAQYLSYLTIEYDDADFAAECTRLQAYDSTEYVGYYSVTGFAEGTELLAMYADSYQGFVYAIETPGRENTITYVEIIFCNYFMDLDYAEYMPAEYFPENFDASLDNPYEQQMMSEN